MAQTHHGALPVGTRIESYEIARVLGGGGFGITYHRVNLGVLERGRPRLPGWLIGAGAALLGVLLFALFARR